MKIDQTAAEHARVKHGQATENYRTIGRIIAPAPVLLFELKHYTVAALRVISARIVPGDARPHKECARQCQAMPEAS